MGPSIGSTAGDRELTPKIASEPSSATVPATQPYSLFGTLMPTPAAIDAMTPETRRSGARRVLPGFGLTLGYTMVYLSLIVLIPLSAVFFRSLGLGWGHFWEVVTAPRVTASLRLSFGASLIAALINAVFGLIVAWVLVRHTFPFKRLLDAIVDLPFALPTAVAGISLTALYAPNGPLGELAARVGIQTAYSPLGIFIAMLFVGLPFVVRQVQPVLMDFDREAEEAASTLGATPAQRFWRVMLPAIAPALLSGFGLAFARAVGEYGSVIFIAGNVPMQSEIAPLLIVAKLEEYDYAGAAAVGLAMVAIALAALVLVNAAQAALARRGQA